MLCHCNNGCTNEFRCYIMHTLLVLFILNFSLLFIARMIQNTDTPYEKSAGWLIASAFGWLRTVRNMCDESIKFVIRNWSIIKCSTSAFIWRSSCKLSQGSRDSFPARSITSTDPHCTFLWCWNLNQSGHSPSQDTF